LKTGNAFSVAIPYFPVILTLQSSKQPPGHLETEACRAFCLYSYGCKHICSYEHSRIC